MVTRRAVRDDDGMSTGAATMKLLHTLLSWHCPALPVVVRAVDAEPVAAEELQAGCGWFDSSHDLRAGLQVREHAANDAVCADLPLELWLQLYQA
jgi:hypothetical protein